MTLLESLPPSDTLITDYVKYASEAVKSDKRVFTNCILKFLTSYMPTLIDLKDVIIDRTFTFMSNHVLDHFPEFAADYKSLELKSGSIASFALTGFDKYFIENHQLKKLIKPLHTAIEILCESLHRLGYIVRITVILTISYYEIK
jgi:hypothetical protein